MNTMKNKPMALVPAVSFVSFVSFARLVFFVCFVSAVLFAAPAFAQSTYIGASFLGEFARFGGVDADDDAFNVITSVEPLSPNGESLGFDLRLGRAIGERWGVEFGFARGGSIEQEATSRALPTTFTRLPAIPGLPSVTPVLPIPIIDFGLNVEQQYTTFDAMAWVRQDLGDRVHLSVLGGVSFARVEAEHSFRVDPRLLAIVFPYPSEFEITRYDTGPVVGAETIIDFGDHAALTAGARLHGVGGGWLIRPSVGLRWSF